MKRFAQLFLALDATTATSAKVEALKRYFAEAAPRDAAWAAYFLAGGKPRQVIATGLLRTLACQRAGIADWLFDAAYQAVGDLAETIAHILPPASQQLDLGLADWIETRLQPQALWRRRWRPQHRRRPRQPRSRQNPTRWRHQAAKCQRYRRSRCP